MNALEVKGLACSRGGATLFRGVSFTVARGEWVALRGPNGSGKTTLLRCAAGLVRPDAGQVIWDGRDASESSALYRRELVYAGHAPGIKDELSAAENLRDALALRAVPVTGESLGEALARAGLERHRHLPARRLSAGQRRRIGLARLALDPGLVWTLDEPLTALDDAGHAIFSSLLERHLARGGLALLATHHDLKPAPAREIRLAA